MGHAEARCFLFGVCEPLKDFTKGCSMSQDTLFVWKSHWKWLGCVSNLGGTGSQGGVNSVSKADEDSDIMPACWLWGRGAVGAQQRNNDLC